MERRPPSALAFGLLRRFTLRHWRGAPGQTAMLLLILALGVGVFLSIRLANRAALASFQNFTELITQQSDWIITAFAGPLPEAVLDELRPALAGYAVHVIPIVETTATLPRTDDEEGIGDRPTFQVLGVDLVGLQNVNAELRQDRPWFGQERFNSAGQNPGGRRFWEVLRSTNSVFVSAALANQRGLRVSSSVTMILNDTPVALEVVGILPTREDSPAAPSSLLVMDLPALQALTGRTGRLDRVELLLEPGPGEEKRRAALLAELLQLGRERWRVTSPEDRREAAATMTRAFRLNLTILSLIALLVGLYLITQALDGAVVRRRMEIGVLRSLGVEASTIRRAWLLEAAALGLAGGALGIFVGWAGSQFAVRLVGRTVNALYYASSVRSAHLEITEAGFALVVAVVASVMAGWIPAHEAARTPPAQILARHVVPVGAGRWSASPWLGVVAVLVGVGLAVLPPLRLDGGVRFPLAGYLAALCWVVGGGILAGNLLGALGWATAPAGGWSVTLRLASSHLRSASSRHRLATAGLLCAVAMTAGMAILVASFESTMQGWIERTFMADLYVSSAGAQSASTENRISPATWRAIVARPEVEDFNAVQACAVQLRDGPTLLTGAEIAFQRRHSRIAWRQEPLREDIFDPARNAELALVSESFTERFGLGRGDLLELPTPKGRRNMRIAGVFCDYGNERGSIVIQRALFASWFDDEHLSGLILKLRDGKAAASVRAELLAGHPGLSVFTNAHLREEILRIFRQTFSITFALEIIGVGVAVIGLGLMLASGLLDRRDELTTLRALGLARTDMARAAAWEGVLVAAAGTVGGVAVSLALGRLLIFVINKQTFGWTLSLVVPWGPIVALSVLVGSAGLVVAWLVGRWGADLPADREE